ncbi:MAG: hypothetical protein JRG67_15545 [Deltaproteobacteria bacterium]|nr:hypothetical protein [Deltaproteobacteria bacterium]
MAARAAPGGTGGQPEVRSYEMLATAFNPGGLDLPLEGARFCEVSTDNCVTTNSSGLATLDVAANQEVTITIEKEGYGPYVTGDVTDETFGPEGGSGPWPAQWRMYADAELEVMAGHLQADYPWTGGIVGLLRWPSPNPGVTFMPVGSTIDAVGESFYFDAETMQYSLDLEATTRAHFLYLYPLAEGGFTEVTPGEHQFELGGTAGNCRASWGWPGDAPNRMRVPVLEGYATYGSMTCDDQ